MSQFVSQAVAHGNRQPPTRADARVGGVVARVSLLAFVALLFPQALTEAFADRLPARLVSRLETLRANASPTQARPHASFVGLRALPHVESEAPAQRVPASETPVVALSQVDAPLARASLTSNWRTALPPPRA